MLVLPLGQLPPNLSNSLAGTARSRFMFASHDSGALHSLCHHQHRHQGDGQQEGHTAPGGHGRGRDSGGRQVAQEREVATGPARAAPNRQRSAAHSLMKCAARRPVCGQHGGADRAAHLPPAHGDLGRAASTLRIQMQVRSRRCSAARDLGRAAKRVRLQALPGGRWPASGPQRSAQSPIGNPQDPNATHLGGLALRARRDSPLTGCGLEC